MYVEVQKDTSAVKLDAAGRIYWNVDGEYVDADSPDAAYSAASKDEAEQLLGEVRASRKTARAAVEAAQKGEPTTGGVTVSPAPRKAKT